MWARPYYHLWISLATIFLLEYLTTIIHSWSLQSFSNRDLLRSSVTKTSPPLPPWKFQATRIHYQFHLFPAEIARNYTPLAKPTNPPLMLLNLFGWTLGGIFCVEYSDSPIGPYREVAILSSLVVDHQWNLGAWASHIYVDSKDAVKYGQKFWGLPANYVSQIDVSSVDEKTKVSRDEKTEAVPSIHFFNSNATIQISDWKIFSTTSKNGFMEQLQIGLPSFSGCLPTDQDQNDFDNSYSSMTTISPLLRYPLTIRRPRSISLSWKCGAIDFSGEELLTQKNINNAFVFDEVQFLLSKGKPTLSMDVDTVELEAGIPEIVKQ